jgi:hypothetical protein
LAKHDPQQVSYMRKDSHFLADGVWYISTPCPIHDLVDEEVSWDEAKTPHHAGVIADRRHAECQIKYNEQQIADARKAEIAAAEREVERIDELVSAAHARLDAAKKAANAKKLAEPTKVQREREVLIAQAEVDRLADSPEHARRRLAETRQTNG